MHTEKLHNLITELRKELVNLSVNEITQDFCKYCGSIHLQCYCLRDE